MDRKAVEKARSRLRGAETQLRVLAQSQSKIEYVDTWYLYLAASKSVYTALEQGAKASVQSLQWWGAMKQERRLDPLLQYMFQARNGDEHELEQPIKFEPMKVEFPENDGGSSFTLGTGGDDLGVEGGGVLIIKSADPDKKVKVRGTIPRMHLTTVTSRGEVKFDPPTMHRGKPLASDVPNYLGQLNLDYLVWLTDEAEKLCKP